jgi:hypothetical protein
MTVMDNFIVLTCNKECGTMDLSCDLNRFKLCDVKVDFGFSSIGHQFKYRRNKQT